VYKIYDKNTRREGNVECIAAFPKLISINDEHHQMVVSIDKGDELIIWRGAVGYGYQYERIPVKGNAVKVPGSAIAGEEKIIIQLLEDGELFDEMIYETSNGKPWLISESVNTSRQIDKKTTSFIKGGTFSFVTEQNDYFIPYPGPANPIDTQLEDFYIDKHPVTNAEFKVFLDASGYIPVRSENFLKHWTSGIYPDSLAGVSVSFVCYDDARAYATWTGKRLPTELEWQYAMSQEDLDYGHVWEMTNDRYDNGSHTFIIIKGGSYYKPESSWWYIQGGKQPPERQQMLLQVSPGFDRASTVGFRCVQDSE